MTTSVRFKFSKDPAESFPLTFDFTPDLASGETVATIVSTNSVVAFGTDPTPLAILAGGNAINAARTQVSVPVTGGLDGTDYDVSVKVTTSAGKTLICAGILPVRVQ